MSQQEINRLESCRSSASVKAVLGEPDITKDVPDKEGSFFWKYQTSPQVSLLFGTDAAGNQNLLMFKVGDKEYLPRYILWPGGPIESVDKV